LSLERRVSRLEDTVVAIRAAWESAGTPLTHAGRFHTWKEATFALPAVRNSHPPIWIGAQGPRACRIAGSHGDGWIYILGADLETWQLAADQVLLGAREAGRDPNTMTRSIFFAPLLARNAQAAEELAHQPMVHAMMLTQPGTAWSAVGAEHPLGRDFAGFSELDPAVLTVERLADFGRHMPIDLIAQLIPLGRAEDIVDRLSPFVEAGVNHIIIYSAATSMKGSLAAGALYEQRRLIRLLKSLSPGRFEGSESEPPAATQDRVVSTPRR